MRGMRAVVLPLLLAGLVGACGAGNGPGTEQLPRRGPISTSSWRPGDPGMDALIRGTLEFTSDGCPVFKPHRGVVWPAGYTSVITSNGERLVVTADGRRIAAGDTVVAGGGIGPAAPSGGPCIRPGTEPSYLQSEVQIVRERHCPNLRSFRVPRPLTPGGVPLRSFAF